MFYLLNKLFRYLFQFYLITQHFDQQIRLVYMSGTKDVINIHEQSISVTYGATVDRSKVH